MKQSIVLFTLLCILEFFFTAEAQSRIPRLIIISLKQEVDSIAIPSQVNLIPGDTLQFVAVNGDFNIQITDAYKFLRIKDDDLKVRVNSSNSPESDLYIVRNIKEYDTKYSIYCISCNGWPLAPPRIIIKVQ
jgi:hypothetical protein